MDFIELGKLKEDIGLIKNELLRNKEVAINCDDYYMAESINNQLALLQRITFKINNQPVYSDIIIEDTKQEEIEL